MFCFCCFFFKVTDLNKPSAYIEFHEWTAAVEVVQQGCIHKRIESWTLSLYICRSNEVRIVKEKWHSIHANHDIRLKADDFWNGGSFFKGSHGVFRSHVVAASVTYKARSLWKTELPVDKTRVATFPHHEADKDGETDGNDEDQRKTFGRCTEARFPPSFHDCRVLARSTLELEVTKETKVEKKER